MHVFINYLQTMCEVMHLKLEVKSSMIFSVYVKPMELYFSLGKLSLRKKLLTGDNLGQCRIIIWSVVSTFERENMVLMILCLEQQ